MTTPRGKNLRRAIKKYLLLRANGARPRTLDRLADKVRRLEEDFMMRLRASERTKSMNPTTIEQIKIAKAAFRKIREVISDDPLHCPIEFEIDLNLLEQRTLGYLAARDPDTK